MANKTVKLDDAPLNWFHARMVGLTLGAHLADGYAIGVIGIALTFIQPQMQLGSVWLGLLGSSALIGLFFGSLLLGRVSDKIGRQKIFLFNFMLITVASALQFYVSTPLELLILRLLIGFGLGGDYSVGVTLLAEFSPRKYRGAFLGALSVIWTFGYVGATIVGYFMTHNAGADSVAWKVLLATSAIPALVILLMRIGTPESPRWLINMGRIEEARAIVKKYVGSNVVLDDETPAKEQSSYSVLFSPKLRKRTAFSSIFFAAIVLPYFAIYTFLPSILDIMKLKSDFGTDLLLNGLLIAGALAGIWFTEIFSRRQFTIGSFVILTICLFLLSVLPSSSTTLVVIAFSVFTFVLSAISNLTGVFPAESFPTEIRTSGVGFATAISRLASAISTFLLPVGLTSMGLMPTMLSLAVCLLLATFVVIAWAPETKKLTLSEASDVALVEEAQCGMLAEKTN
ncbi:MFS transporter [Sporomusa sp.]|uniref:MFS transporter n=1 Tax=Sporomusa sp. TaxID=2078658 RepID=UPI002B719608|nr:MFS transporter [Sporomusa sp.]HWR41734.1 MFS transporter [Sporomusa sp.]